MTIKNMSPDELLALTIGQMVANTFADNKFPRTVVAVCANCYHTTLCADDGEAFICVNTARCLVNCANPVFACEGCGCDTHIRLNGLCVECANGERDA